MLSTWTDTTYVGRANAGCDVMLLVEVGGAYYALFSVAKLLGV
jgi:hypothetical protein